MLQVLKVEVEVRFGRKIAYQKDCNTLSNMILETQKEYISPATLRRVFGFLTTNSNPSRVTLDILSRYVGFQDWENFNQKVTKNNPTTKYSSVEQWNIIKENSKIISSNTVENIRLKSGIDFEKTVRRQFAKDRLKEFINSDYAATAIIAPGGYGKSTLLALWYSRLVKKKKQTEDLFLFISAQMLDQFAPTEVFIETWLMRLLGLKPDNSFLNDMILENTKTPGKLIVIIDALDEITSQGLKQEKIFKSLADLANKFHKSSSLKLIISTRLPAWKSFSSHISDTSHWYFTETNLFTNDGANIPPLNFEEIQTILDNTLNQKFDSRTLVHEMHPDLRSIIAYPYFLQLFIQVYTPETKHLLNDQIAILAEFLKKQIYFSQYSDEKIDILNQIITQSEYGLTYVLKDDLKKIYPIHLKLSGNYYTAYEELYSFGIITEETQIDTFGGYIKHIKIANHQLMCMLIVQNLIRREQGINHSLFRWVDKNLAGAEIQGTILGMVFKVAYKERLFKQLENFFDLSDSALQAALSTPTIPSTLRTDKIMRNELVPHYAKNKKARALLFEKNIDFNHIVDSYTKQIKEYLQNSESEAEYLFANTILTHIGQISTNAPLAIKHFSESANGNPSVLSPSIAGLWFSNSIVHNYLFEDIYPKDIIDSALAHCECYKEQNQKVDFAESFIPALILLEKYEFIPKFIELTDTLKSPNHQSAICFLLTKTYRLFHQKKPINSAESNTIEQVYSLLNPLNNYMGIIFGETLRSVYFLQSNNLDETYSCIRNAIELSSIAQYKLVEMVLMRNLAITLQKLGENQRSAECMNYVKSMWKLSGFKKEFTYP